MKEVAEKLQRSISKKETIILGALCSISYSGRAESYLPEGERIIIIKQDGTLLIHQPTANNPVNYMKPGTTCRVEIDKELFIYCSNESIKEYMTITISSILFFVSQKLNDSSSLILHGNERDFSDELYSHPEYISNDFKPVSREEQTKYGFIDILGYDKNNTLVIVECKRFKAGPDAVTQLRRYVERVKKDKGLSTIKGMLIAPDITKNALAMLTEYGYTYKKFDPPKYKLQHKKNQKKLMEY
jgi:endonuclease